MEEEEEGGNRGVDVKAEFDGVGRGLIIALLVLPLSSSY
jgi:hypothetical protein